MRPRCAVLKALTLSGLLLGVPLGSAALAAPVAYNTTLVGRLAMSPTGSTTDLWVVGNYVYLGRGSRGMSVIDVSNPALPVKVADWSESGVDIGDVTANGNRVYLSSQGSSGTGVYIVDVTNPTAPTTIGRIRAASTNSVHTLYIDGFTLYCSSNATGDLRIWNVTNPASPQELSHVSPGGWHESTVMNGVCYDAAGTGNLHIYDVSNPSVPAKIGQAIYNKPDTIWYTHSAWPSADAQHLFTCDEYTQVQSRWTNGGVRVWDISNVAMPVQKAVWKSDLGLANSQVTVHKPKVYGNRLDLSYYQDGVRVLDITDPEIPIEVGFFDTYPDPPQSLFQGCWGVIESNGLIYASDIKSGLFIISYNGTLGGSVTGTVTSATSGLPIKKATIYYVEPNRRTRSNAAGTYTMRTGAGVHSVQVSAAGYQTLFDSAEVTAGAAILQDFVLTPAASSKSSAAATGTDAMAPDGAAEAPPSVVSFMPNPTRGPAVLNLALDEATHVTVRLYDPAGREVATIADGTFPAGVSGVRFGGLAGGRPLARGVYLWRAAVGGERLAGRLVVVE